MSAVKVTKDWVGRFLLRAGDSLLGTKHAPAGLVELHQYFRLNPPIKFDFHNAENSIVAISTNFRCGSIITSGKNKEELDRNIKDAILTSFEVPSSYSAEAKITLTKS